MDERQLDGRPRRSATARRSWSSTRCAAAQRSYRHIPIRPDNDGALALALRLAVDEQMWSAHLR
jgi:hypothetical protein